MTACQWTSNALELHQLELWIELPLLHCPPKLAIRLWLQHEKQDGQLLECPSTCTPFSQFAPHQLHDCLGATKVHGDAGHSIQILKAMAKFHAKCHCHEPHDQIVFHVRLVLGEASADVHLGLTLMSARHQAGPGRGLASNAGWLSCSSSTWTSGGLFREASDISGIPTSSWSTSASLPTASATLEDIEAPRIKSPMGVPGAGVPRWARGRRSSLRLR